MAKGLRSSRNKTNNSKLRSKVFGPVESARKERLSAKLLDLATKAKPDPKKYEDTGMDVDERGLLLGIKAINTLRHSLTLGFSDSEGVEQKGAALSAGFKSDEQSKELFLMCRLMDVH